jgi:membrane fusion protein (multidrug efflux system)
VFKKNIKSGLGVIIIGILALVSYELLSSREEEETDNAYLKADIVIIRPKVNGYITKLLVADNQLVKAGQVIAEIDKRDYEYKVTQAQSTLNAARAKLSTIEEQLKLQEFEINQAESEHNSAKALLETVTKDLNRSKELVKVLAVSQQVFEQHQEAEISARNSYLAASAKLAAAKQTIGVLKSQTQEQDAQIAGYEANLELAKLDLDNTFIRASTTGFISRKSLQVGQLVNSGIALAYVVPTEVWVLANFKEVQVGKMRSGQEAKITIDSFPGKVFKGKVDSISPATGAEFSILPPENATGNFTKIVQRMPVKITFDIGQDLPQLKAGLSSEVTVITR